MTKRVSEILYEMAAEEGFYFLDIERFCKKNKDEIQKLNTIFDTDDDRNDEIMDVAHYLISKTFDNFENYEKPENFENDKNLVLAGFIENQSFFSMCWNYMLMEKHKVSIVPKKVRRSNENYLNNILKFKTYSFGDNEYKAAASEGMRNFGEEHSIENFGLFGQQCDNEDREYQFYLVLNDSVVTKKFRCEIEFMNSNEKYSSVILSNGDGTKILHSDPIEVQDIYSGIKDLVIKIFFE